MATVSTRLSFVLASLVLVGLATTSCRPGPAAALDAVPGCDEIVFVQRVSGNDHWYGNFGHYCETESPYAARALTREGDMRYAFGNGGRLCRLNLQTGKLRVLLTDPYDIILIRHLAYYQLGEAPLHQALCNLDRPKKSLLLLQAPLAGRAGGLQLCGTLVFQGETDRDYREILDSIEDAAARLVRHRRFDMPGFRPNRFYIREMQHFGILPRGLPDDTPVDTYAVERAYWNSVVAPGGRAASQ